jgi:hypothetical protein
MKAPPGKSKSLQIAPATAQQLAYYHGNGAYGVLAPRGWYCFSSYGSMGTSLYVSSQPITSGQISSSTWKPTIELDVSFGGTSGRWQVAEIIAHVFPAHMNFVRNVIAQGVAPKSAFPVGPFPGDDLKYLSQEVVEYETPPNVAGLGTQSQFLLQGAYPIVGVAILTGPETDLVQLSARLPPALAGLEPIIVHQVEADVKSFSIQ